jgi:type I restriction enzyme M protein
MAKAARAKKTEATATLGFETQLWAAADTLRGNLESSEYKHVVLGLIFLKYVSDSFEERHAQLVDEAKIDAGVDPEDRDEYTSRNVLFLPPHARWQHLRDRAKSPDIGSVVDAAMKAVEDSDRTGQLRGVLPNNYARPALDKTRLGQVIDLLSNVGVGGTEHRAKDTLGRVYEYFLGQFATAEGRRGGEFYTPTCVVGLLVEMLQPRPNSRIFDPCCGSGGMFVQSEKFIEAHGGTRKQVAVYGQEMNHTTLKLCRMNLAIRGIEASVLEGDTFREDRHPDLRADYVLANPPFNMSDWGGEAKRDDVRWKGYEAPPVGNANYAWVLHFVHHLAPNGTAGFVMANGSMSTSTTAELAIRRQLVENDLVDCMVALPGQLFYTTQIPVCLWFLAKNKKAPGQRDRRGHTLFIDARKMGTLKDRIHRELTADNVKRIAGTYRAWRGTPEPGDPKTYADEAGFCKSAAKADVVAHDYVLTPGRYVGAADIEYEGEAFEERMPKLVAKLKEQFAESAKLEAAIRANLGGLGL